MPLPKSQYQRVSVTNSLLCAGLGLVTAVVIVTLFFGLLLRTGLHQLLAMPVFQGPVVLGVTVLFAAALVLGRVAGNLIYRFGPRSRATPIIGIFLAWSCVVISGLAASMVNYSPNREEPEAFASYVIKPMYAILFFGIIPALILGLVYSVRVRKALAET